ncbi:MAG: NADH-quinone oxidoreductase subunit NuoF [Clostridiales bacterium]|jgi:NADH:ubiquinone oxidoreductase subunit F (NADH-binding)/(2Fe-2S) ferredoxin|nr:NADH-quinone oxidoreductase subunit NuoF [Clostridiales bacterium]
MGKINSLDELKKLKEQAKANTELRATNQNKDRIVILVGMATCGVAAGAREIMDTLLDEIHQNNLKNVSVVSTGCIGFCYAEPLVEVRMPGKEPVRYANVSEKLAKEIIEKHVMQGSLIDNAVLTRKLSPSFEYDEEKEHHELESGDKAGQDDSKNQFRIALRNCGMIDPEKIEDYIAANGYEALGIALKTEPDAIIKTIKDSGLRGRGGAGFPTGLKWEAAKKSVDDVKYVICNADEGDPGAFMDRAVLEGDPHSVLEAMAICGHAIGANDGVIYIRAEYPLAVKRLRNALKQAEELGLLGDNIMGSGFNFHININLGAGAFVCGEETSLMNSVQGNRGEPRVKPPFPAQKGLWMKPTNINNVETYANVCPIILNGADWFASIGTEKSKGTKVFALAGKINNVGLAEVPMGTSLRDIIYNIGGGIRNGKAFKAVQTGGPSGGCIPTELLDLKIDYESLQSVGSMMGSGGMIVMDEDDCMVDIAKYYLEFTVDESCGKCTPCRIGNRRMHEILERITKGNGTKDDLDKLKELGEIIKDCALCGLGQTAPNPVLSTLKYFYNEYEDHINGKCTAGKCKDLIKYVVIPEKCIGCTLCARNCPASCIEGERKKPHKIIQEKCIKCGVCFQKCPVNAIERK